MSTIWGFPTIRTVIDLDPPPPPPPPPAPAQPDNASPATAGSASAIAILLVDLVTTVTYGWEPGLEARSRCVLGRAAVVLLLGPDHLRSKDGEPASLAGAQSRVGDQDLEVRDLGEAAEARHAELGVQPHEDAAPGALDHRALDRGDR